MNIITLVVAGAILMFLCWLKFFPQSWLARLFGSQRTVGELGVTKRELLSQTGVAISQLRPSGAAFINGKRVDVITEGAVIDEGASIRVVAVQGARVVVRAM